MAALLGAHLPGRRLPTLQTPHVDLSARDTVWTRSLCILPRRSRIRKFFIWVMES